jgi:4-hydroxy-4-methyl-2-oxoglutarate aldolase
MIEDPPLLTIRREFPRPTPGQVAALAGAPTSFLVDCLGGHGAVDYRIKPLDPAHKAAGVAVTCHAGPADNLAVFAAISILREGDVLLAASDGHVGCAVIGDRVMGMIRNQGAAGCVTDGLVRDIDGIAAVGVPVFCRGVSPNSPARLGPGSVGLPILLGGVRVCPGDVVVGDKDGVVVVPLADIDRVIQRLAIVQAKEIELDAQVAAGLAVPPAVAALLASDRVRYID